METRKPAGVLDVERAVRDRYSKGARQREENLCCTVSYDSRYLEAIPEEVLKTDYGCGDPSRHVQRGDTVVDLGSGGGKICFIASQIAGPEGKVLGVDMNREMLALAREAEPKVAARLGYSNISFHRGRIQDLRLDLERLDSWLAEHPVGSSEDLSALEAETERLRREHPLIPDGSVDIVVSNCVLNLVRDSDKSQLIREIYRILRRGGRIAISDIVSDEDVPSDLKQDPDLWTGCVTGAFREDLFLRELEEAGFHGIAIDRWTDEPFRVVRGIEFRPVVVTARKGKEGPCVDANQAVIYRGPWRQVEDDDNHVFRRGERVAVCEKTFGILTSPPYAGQIVPVPSRVELPAGERRSFDCSRPVRRHPRETKGRGGAVSAREGQGSAAPGGCC